MTAETDLAKIAEEIRNTAQSYVGNFGLGDYCAIKRELLGRMCKALDRVNAESGADSQRTAKSSNRLGDIDLRELIRAYEAQRNPTPMFADVVIGCLYELRERRAAETSDRQPCGCHTWTDVIGQKIPVMCIKHWQERGALKAAAECTLPHDHFGACSAEKTSSSHDVMVCATPAEMYGQKSVRHEDTCPALKSIGPGECSCGADPR